MTRTHFILLTLFLCPFIPPASADDTYRGYSARRYDVVWQRSLFKVSHSRAPEVSVQWTLSGVFKYDGGLGAVILNRDTGEFEEIETDQKNESGFRLIRVQSHLDGTPVRVEVAHEGSTFWVTNLSR